jgi:hypothetical protein
MFSFAIVSSNAWVQQCKTTNAGQKSLAKHARWKFLTNPDASGKIGNNQEGDLVIGNNREPDYREKSGVIGSVESQFLESQLFCKFSAKCQIPDFCGVSLHFTFTGIHKFESHIEQEIRKFLRKKKEFCTGSFAILILFSRSKTKHQWLLPHQICQCWE